MRKKVLKQLIDVSYMHDELDAITIEKISSLLTRKELREYINALKKSEKSRYVIITGARDLSPKSADLAKQFPNKKLVFQTDPSLLVGMQVIDNDMIYELSLKNTLEQLQIHINE